MGNQKNYGELLKKMRIEAGMNHEQLGVAIDRSSQSIRNWEKGIHIPDVESWDKIVAVCKAKISHAA